MERGAKAFPGVLGPGVPGRCPEPLEGVFMPAQTRHDRPVRPGAGDIVLVDEQIFAGKVETALRKLARLVEHIPGLQLSRDPEIDIGTLRTAFDQGPLQRLHGGVGLPLPGADLGDLFHPLRIAIRPLIQCGVSRSGLFEAHQAFFQPRPRRIKFGALGPDFAGARPGLDGRRKIFEMGLQPSQYHRPAKVSWRIRGGFSVVAGQLRLALVL